MSWLIPFGVTIIAVVAFHSRGRKVPALPVLSRRPRSGAVRLGVDHRLPSCVARMGGGDVSATTEKVHFRLIQMPCCGHLFCNVNPRLPSYCPMCGRLVYPDIRGAILISDDDAMLKFDGEKKP